MSKAGITAALPKPSHGDRRELMRLLFKFKGDAEPLRECDRLALERFQALDAMEARMLRTLPGEIWRIDFGLAAKVRPALILSGYPRDDELALLIVVPHTTAVRGNRWEFPIPKPFLRPGVFYLQQIQPIPTCRE